jgi:hypothetical protein
VVIISKEREQLVAGSCCQQPAASSQQPKRSKAMLTLETSLTLRQVGEAVYSVPGVKVDAGLPYPQVRVTVRGRGALVDVLPVGGFVISAVLAQEIRAAVAAAQEQTA